LWARKNAPSKSKKSIKEESRRATIVAIFAKHKDQVWLALQRMNRDLRKGRAASRWVEIQIGTKTYRACIYRSGLALCRWSIYADDGVCVKSQDFSPPPCLDGLFALEKCLLPLLADGNRHLIDLEMRFDVRSDVSKNAKVEQQVTVIRKGGVIKRQHTPIVPKVELADLTDSTLPSSDADKAKVDTFKIRVGA
jgi:hypothetical protein